MQVLNIFHVLIAIAMVALVLVQRGAGATAGAAFGSGASGTVFGSRGAGTFLTKSTWVLATLFCAISLTMAVIVSRSVNEPGTDLGVVGGTPAAAERAVEQADEAITTEALLESGEAQQDDLPLLQTETAAEDALQQAAEDLPALDGVISETVEDQDDTGSAAADSEDS